jgi:hypothetical protein
MIRGEAHAMGENTTAGAVPASRARAGSSAACAWLARTNKWALVSLPLSAAWLEGLGSALGIVAAVIAIRQIRASDLNQRGYWLSVSSIAVGVAGLLAVLVLGMVAYFHLATSIAPR